MSLRLPRDNHLDEYASCPVNANAFPGKLWKLVNDPNFRSIEWGSCGTTIIVDAHEFKEEVLRTGDSIFKTQNFSSFVRQLNLYGFRKLASTPTKLAEESKGGSYTRPIHCFSHSSFIRHRPDLLLKVRRTTSTSKRRPGDRANAYYYGQYGNTFRILSRYENNSVSPYIAQSHLKGTTPSHNYSMPSVGKKESESKAKCRGKDQARAAANTDHPMDINQKGGPGTPFSSSCACSDSNSSDEDAENEVSNSAPLFKPSSANVLWGQGFVGSVSEDESPRSSPHLTLIAKAEKGSVKAIRTTEEMVSFPSCLYDTHGRLQKFVVIQQSPKLGTFPRTRVASTSSSVNVDPNVRQTVSPTVWSPAYSSGHYMPVDMDADPYHGYHQWVDYSSMPFPYGAGYMVPYIPEYMCLPSFVHPDNMMPAGYYAGDGLALSTTPPSFTTPSSTMGPTTPHSSGRQSAGTGQDEGETRAGHRQSSNKVVVKQEADSTPHQMYCAFRDGWNGSRSPYSASTTPTDLGVYDHQRD